MKVGLLAVTLSILALQVGVALIGAHFSVTTSNAPSTDVTSANFNLWDLITSCLDWAWDMSTWQIPNMPAGITAFWNFLNIATIVCIIFLVRGVG